MHDNCSYMLFQDIASCIITRILIVYCKKKNRLGPQRMAPLNTNSVFICFISEVASIFKTFAKEFDGRYINRLLPKLKCFEWCYQFKGKHLNTILCESIFIRSHLLKFSNILKNNQEILLEIEFMLKHQCSI